MPCNCTPCESSRCVSRALAAPIADQHTSMPSFPIALPACDCASKGGCKCNVTPAPPPPQTTTHSCSCGAGESLLIREATPAGIREARTWEEGQSR
ncbi:hypothetical protein M427DRAFT_52184 [Gonapodya prolifera JEL478]|uniref:Uncharacterized protein n=1 Tax=Gonapodya prolifera (strain JEL478) TaxID=1344416 RepID=A0A139AVI2_GONPJ|nr:hypothetical protein M427DRAFT_52184 [Gonapodya prolifera JEL478]|eukprot:KXS20593.1 hypothetical protein M427DRAFT_52184 [Gonapodya prolifera JEL478]